MGPGTTFASFSATSKQSEATMPAGSTLNPGNLTDVAPHNPLTGHDTKTLGPSDSSDSGSDIAGAGPADDDSDRSGTGERAAVGRKRRTRTDADLDTDRVVGGDEAGVAGDEQENDLDSPGKNAGT
jgi:hypothetical protein